MARIANSDNTEVYWEFMIHGDDLKMTLPFLPPETPAAGTGYTWQHFAPGLSYYLASFDFIFSGFLLTPFPNHGIYPSTGRKSKHF